MPTLVEELRADAKAYSGMLHDAHAARCVQAADALDAAEKREQWLIEQLAPLWKLSEKNVRALLNKDLPRARSTGGDGDE